MLTRPFSSVEVHLHTRGKVRTDRFHIGFPDSERAGGNRRGVFVEGTARGENASAAIESYSCVVDVGDGALSSRNSGGQRISGGSNVALGAELNCHLAESRAAALEIHTRAVH